MNVMCVPPESGYGFIHTFPFNTCFRDLAFTCFEFGNPLPNL